MTPMLDQTKLTPREKEILGLLSHGEWVSTVKLIEDLSGDEIAKKTLRIHMQNLRKKLLPQGYDISTRLFKYKMHWCFVRRMNRG